MNLNEVTSAKVWRIPKIVIGCWQLSQEHAGTPAQSRALLSTLEGLVEKGFNTFDCADIYTGVEETLGQLNARQNRLGREIKIHTKFVPDFNVLQEIDRNYVRQIVERSRCRLQKDTLDLVQFHWWSYEKGDYLESLNWLREMQEEGIIKKIGLTNFNTYHTRRIIEAGHDIAATQVQYSLLDTRPEASLSTLAKQHGVQILSYGVLGGGFLTDRWLGAAEPKLEELTNRSLVKYKLVIDDCGGWSHFQDLLKGLDILAKELNVSISDIALAFVLQSETVETAILGLSDRTGHVDLERLLNLDLKKLYASRLQHHCRLLPGDVYELKRQLGGKHARIMRYDLNEKCQKDKIEK